MTKKRLFWVFFIIMAGFSLLELRLFWLMSDYESARAASAAQSTGSIHISSVRPGIFDRNMQPLTEGESTLFAVAAPGDIAGYDLSDYMEQSEIRRLNALLQSAPGMPEVFHLKSALPGYIPAKQVQVSSRCSEENLLPHILGYLDSEGCGVSGIEKAFEDYLGANTVDISAEAVINAVGDVRNTGFAVTGLDEVPGGITLTIDAEIQRIAKAAAEASFKKGAIVVLDAATSEILASVSLPDFSLSDPSASIGSEDSPFVNRVLSAYNAGSVFKPIVAAAALDSGIREFEYICEGSVECGDVTFRCNEGAEHGEVNLQKAISMSCNCYFVALGQKVGFHDFRLMADSARIGIPTELAPGMWSHSGNLPSTEELSSPSEFANVCFGQGKLLTTPLQVAAYTAAIANGGVYNAPSLILSAGEERYPKSEPSRIMSEGTARKLSSCLEAAVLEGTGYLAAPSLTTAAGKTGTAEAGRNVIGWFSGWFPAEKPQYVVTVMVEGAGYGYSSAAPVFAAVADGIMSLPGDPENRQP